MLKYTNSQVTFSEVPDNISLCIDISECIFRCKGCHSPQLWEDIGTPLTIEEINNLINNNEGITCLTLLGGDKDPSYINSIASWVKKAYPVLKVAWYSGREYIPNAIDLRWFDYIKLGAYKEEYGPLNKETTNQRMYEILHDDYSISHIKDITYKFQKHKLDNETKD